MALLTLKVADPWSIQRKSLGFKLSSVFSQQKKVIQVCNDTRVSK